MALILIKHLASPRAILASWPHAECFSFTYNTCGNTLTNTYSTFTYVGYLWCLSNTFTGEVANFKSHIFKQYALIGKSIQIALTCTIGERSSSEAVII